MMNDIDSTNNIVNILTNPVSSENSFNLANGVQELDKSIRSSQSKVNPEESVIDDSSSFDIESVKESLNKVNDFLSVKSTNLTFFFDEKGDPPIIQVIDKDNDEVIREIPSKEFREVAKALKELADKLDSKGALVNQIV
jgi:uncharacterized FlaG/YvyC family protein